MKEKKTRLDYYDEQLVMKFNKMQAVVRVLKNMLDIVKCGITLEVFEEPVILTNGQTYSKAAIDKWFEKNATCPNTGVYIWKKYYPNYAMKAIIEAFKAAVPAICDFQKAIKLPNKPPAAEAGEAEVEEADADAAEAGADTA